ncbi:MAG TPA: L-threonylcarbamoyladenylate synthase [Bacteroidales bacterium]|nr:L-threonylcarbamoyladenylate synthase [Bacteroidales bacterium]
MLYEADIKAALTVLKEGGIILYPTDTIWGLGCDATNQSAVEKIFRIKSRETTKSLLILVNGEDMLERYVKNIPEVARELVNVSESPLTLIYPEGRNLAPGVCSSDGTVGIRICHEEFCNELISRFRKPIVSTSANFSGRPSPALYDEINSDLAAMAGYVVRYRRDDRQAHRSSPVIKVDNSGIIRIIRE